MVGSVISIMMQRARHDGVSDKPVGGIRAGIALGLEQPAKMLEPEYAFQHSLAIHPFNPRCAAVEARPGVALLSGLRRRWRFDLQSAQRALITLAPESQQITADFAFSSTKDDPCATNSSNSSGMAFNSFPVAASNR